MTSKTYVSKGCVRRPSTRPFVHRDILRFSTSSEPLHTQTYHNYSSSGPEETLYLFEAIRYLKWLSLSQYCRLLLQNYCMSSYQACQKCLPGCLQEVFFLREWFEIQDGRPGLRHFLIFSPKQIHMKSPDLSEIFHQRFRSILVTFWMGVIRNIQCKMAALVTDWSIHF